MTTAVFTRTGRLADQVRNVARSIDPLKAALTFLLVLPFLVGWLCGALVRTIWAIVSTTWAAFVVGFRATQGGHEDAPG